MFVLEELNETRERVCCIKLKLYFIAIQIYCTLWASIYIMKTLEDR